eukprot:143053-Pyramimonas_sp.AAC.1
MDYARPRASAGEVLQGVLGYVHEHGPLSWQSAVNLLCRELPPRRLAIIEFTVWMRAHQYEHRSETAVFWSVYREFCVVGPPNAGCYALDIY